MASRLAQPDSADLPLAPRTITSMDPNVYTNMGDRQVTQLVPQAISSKTGNAGFHNTNAHRADTGTEQDVFVKVVQFGLDHHVSQVVMDVLTDTFGMG